MNILQIQPVSMLKYKILEKHTYSDHETMKMKLKLTKPKK